jgi:hypothetical protein
MINATSLGRLKAFILALCVLSVAGCSAVMLSPVDAQVPGSSRLTAEGYTERYAGNSIAYSRKAGGPKTSEAYFGKDGSYYAVDLDREVIWYGKWSVNSGLGTNLNLNETTAGIIDGEPFRTSPEFVTMFAFVLPDGTASVFSRSPQGPVLFDEPKPTPGFQAQARFNALKRKIDAAIATARAS